MIGAIIGDIVGSRFEFGNTSDYNFELFSLESGYTDDSVCSVAVADAILRGAKYEDVMVEWCKKYPHPMGAYGSGFSAWLSRTDSERKPYYSFGNGAAMRISAVGWAFETEAETIRQAIRATDFTHNHPEGLIGATCVALAIFRLRNHLCTVEDVAESLMPTCYGADWEEHLSPRGRFDETCQGCVPIAFHILKQSKDFEDAIRQAIVYGGDSDTLGAIVGGMAEATFGIDNQMVEKAITYLPKDMKKVVEEFRKKFVLRLS